MALEIEHKYLVSDESFREEASEVHLIRQGYLNRTPERTVRIRILDEKGYITVKGKNKGDKRHEFEYEIPLSDAEKMLDMCLPGVIEKKRHIVIFKGFRWEIDEFFGNRLGLITAEIELPSSDTVYPLPSFVGDNITGNSKYYNSNL
ncbi:MAG: CYTH domain-containing protein [Muribaculaceae bacterium]|nr:CYTH domain-containing protein [Muribaculaceae bacterium]